MSHAARKQNQQQARVHEHAQLRHVIQRANASNDKQMYMRTRSDDGTPGAQSVVAACGALVPLQSASVASASTSQAAVNQCTPPIAAPIGLVTVAVFTTMMCTVLWCDWSASVSAKNV